ncbi:hypothetical protein GCM10008942_15670 [Rhizomicrobium electricum]|uniref:Uncharacterized protein n=1 Tax=Rhizomicrobium electricum TaxID=480070 RepID=A0ABP3PMK3_9PROT
MCIHVSDSRGYVPARAGSPGQVAFETEGEDRGAVAARINLRVPCANLFGKGGHSRLFAYLEG